MIAAMTAPTHGSGGGIGTRDEDGLDGNSFSIPNAAVDGIDFSSPFGMQKRKLRQCRHRSKDNRYLNIKYSSNLLRSEYILKTKTMETKTNDENTEINKTINLIRRFTFLRFRIQNNKCSICTSQTTRKKKFSVF